MAQNVRYKKGGYRLWTWPVADTVVIEQGQIVNKNSGNAEPVNAVTDNLALIGVAYSSHDGDGAGEVSVYMPLPETEFEVELDAATTFAVGDNFQWHANGLKKSDTDPIAVATEKGVNATKVLFAFKLPAYMVGDAS